MARENKQLCCRPPIGRCSHICILPWTPLYYTQQKGIPCFRWVTGFMSRRHSLCTAPLIYNRAQISAPLNSEIPTVPCGLQLRINRCFDHLGLACKRHAYPFINIEGKLSSFYTIQWYDPKELSIITVVHFASADGVQWERIEKRNKLCNQKHTWYQASDSHFLVFNLPRKTSISKWLVKSFFIIRTEETREVEVRKRKSGFLPSNSSLLLEKVF